MITKKQGIAYAAITLDLLYKMKLKVSPEVIAEQMSLVYDLYDNDEVEDLYYNMIHNNKILQKNIIRCLKRMSFFLLEIVGRIFL